MSNHYKYSASGSKRWMNCPGAPNLIEQAPRQESGKAALLGTAAHFFGEYCLRTGYHPKSEFLGVFIHLNKYGNAYQMAVTSDTTCPGHSGVSIELDAHRPTKQHPHVFEINQKMVGAVSVYVDLARGIYQKYPKHDTLIEQKFELNYDMGGSADLVIIAGEKLFVIDYKNGHMPVDAVNNPQLAMYAIGAYRSLPTTSIVSQITVAIVQPNSEGPNVKTWHMSLAELIEWENKINNARARCESHPYEYNMGDWCQWCAGSPKCPLQKKIAMDVFDSVDTSDKSQEYLEFILNNSQLIKDHIEACEKQALTVAKDLNVDFPGFKLVRASTKRAVINKHGLIEKLKEHKIQGVFEPKLIALSKLEKIVDDSILGSHIYKPEGALVLAPVDDKRKSIKTDLLSEIPDLEE